MTEQPEKARSKNAPATARLLEGLRCEATGPNGETSRTDMPPIMGGSASAPNPGWLLRTIEAGLDDKIQAGLSSLATRVKIGASGASADQLRELAEWGDRHSPVACTARIPPAYALEVEVV